MNLRDFFSGIAFLTLGCIAVWVGKGFYADAAYIPIGVGCLMGLFSLPLIWRGASSGLSRRNSANLLTPLVDHPGRFIATLASTLVYYLAMPSMGFYTASFLFIIILALVLGERRPIVVIANTVGFISLLYGLFALVLNRPLPVEFFLAS